MVRKEFNSFGDVLDKAQDKIKKAGEDIEKLVGTRTRAIQRSLRGVEELPAGDLPQLSISDDTLSNDVDDTFE
jgi:DNA recombination protein RmuC